MNNLEFSFDSAPWEELLESVRGRVCAAQLLSMMENEDVQTLEDALEVCREKHLALDISQLPKLYGTGEYARRLREEEQWAKKNLPVSEMQEGDPLRIFLEEVALTPACGDEDILAEQSAGGDEGAMTRLMNLNLSRIISAACAHTGRGVALMDLIQEGSLGLMQAVYAAGNFSAERDWQIGFAMARAAVIQAHAEGVGVKLRQDMEDYRAVDERLLSELGRNATAWEIADAMHISPEHAESLAAMVAIARKLKQALPEEPEEAEIPQEEDQAVEDTTYFQTRQRVNDMLSGLNEQEAKVIALRFGLEGGLPLSPEDTGRKLNLTSDEVVAIEAAALAKMRKQ